ncbi:MAG: CHRD domain-containing protein [Phycisphaerae bacterium]
MKHGFFRYASLLIALAALQGCDVVMDSNDNENMNDDTGGDVALSFGATVSGDQEVPPVEGDGTGAADFDISEDGTSVTFTITAEGLTGPVTAMHLHMGAAGENGGVIVDLGDAIENGDDGTMTANGTASLDSGVADSIRAGNVYLNIHTDANPSGEIRGQLEENPMQ